VFEAGEVAVEIAIRIEVEVEVERLDHAIEGV
jgi:hypothetical protein